MRIISKDEVKKLEIKCFLSNENDTLDSYLEFHAGAGGTESQDWALMLRRMYMKWASNKGYDTKLISEHRGDEAGIKSSVIKISGEKNDGHDFIFEAIIPTCCLSDPLIFITVCFSTAILTSFGIGKSIS